MGLKFRLVGALICAACVSDAPAYTASVASGASDAVAEAEFIKVLAQGGEISFGEGCWTINLRDDESDVLADVTILGANTVDADLPDEYGAYDGDHIKTSITFTGYSMQVTPACSNLTIRSLQWIETGMRIDARHQPTVCFDNVLFDISSWNKSLWGKVIVYTFDGVQGDITHTTFRGFGAAAVRLNRSVGYGVYPLADVGKLIYDRCLFDPDEEMRAGNKLAALNHDAGNDEYAPTFDHGGKEIKNSRFIDCRIGCSKGSNFSVVSNVFEFTDYPGGGEALHFEEFSHDIIIHGNTFRLLGTNAWKFFTIGAQQTCSDITITENRIEQTGQLQSFISGAGVENLTINGNEIENPVEGAEYIALWGGNNVNINIGTDGLDQPGLGVDYQSISTGTLDGILEENAYYMIWGTDEYLAFDDGAVTLVQQSTVPADDKFKWQIKEEQVGYMANYYTLQNQNGSGFYLEVLKGPTAPEQTAQLAGADAVEYTFDGTQVHAVAAGIYAETDRKPGFAIFEKDGTYCLLPGGNEKRSDLRKDGDGAVVYVVKDETVAEYGWSFVPAVLTGFAKFADDYDLVEGKDGNEDGDCLSDWGEYVFGGNPIDPADVGTQPTFDVVSGTYTYSLMGDDCLTAHVLTNSNLVDGVWKTNDTLNVTATNRVVDVYSRTLETTEGRLFIKLKVE